MFGLELRRKDNITNLYSDVDVVLKKAGVDGRDISANVQSSAVAHSLHNMLKGKYFSVCTIDACVKVVGLRIPSERYSIYLAQHCIDWADMLPDFRQTLIAMLLDDFREVLNPAKEIGQVEKT